MAKKSKLNLSVFKRLLSYWSSYKGLFFLAVFCTLVLASLGPFRPWLIGDIVNKYIVETKDADSLLIWTLIVIAILIIEGLFQFLSSYFSNLFAQSIILDLRKRLMAKLLTFRMSYFDKTPIGALVTRVVSDLEAITEVFSAGLMAIIGDLITLIAVITVMCFIDFQLTLIILLPIPILIIATRIFARVVRGTLQEEQKQVTRLNNFVQERLTGMSLVRMFNREKVEFDSFKEINKSHRQAHISAVWAYSIFFPVVELLSSLSIALLLVFSALKIEGKSVDEIKESFGSITAMILYVHMLYRPIRMLADKFNILQRGTVRAERVFEILDLDDHIQDNGNINNCDFNQDIKFDNLYFSYSDNDWVLKNINLTIPKGSTVAFVGATGAGKSSLVNLIGRFYEYQKGAITLGDIALKDIELSYLRKNIAIVLQDVFLFSDTILNNITLGDTSISREQVIAAAKAVGVNEFIEKLPGGYDFVISERGEDLSVGQRQLLSFIRAYVYNPKVLILDEATSSVDNESEELIQLATKKITQGRTSVVIAHRLSTIHDADLIVVLDKGEVVEKGTHSELLDLKGYYYNLYELQFENKEQ